MDWQNALIPLVSVLVGAAASVLGGYLLATHQEATRRRDQALRAIGSALSALRELDPGVWAERLRVYPEGAALMQRKWERWYAAADNLELLAARESGGVAALSENVIDRGGLVAIRLDEITGAAKEPSLIWIEVVEKAHAEAVTSARKLLKLIR